MLACLLLCVCVGLFVCVLACSLACVFMCLCVCLALSCVLCSFPFCHCLCLCLSACLPLSACLLCLTLHSIMHRCHRCVCIYLYTQIHMLLPMHCRCKQLIPVDPAKFYSVPWLSFSKAAPDFQSQSRPVVRREALMTCSPYGICGKERDPLEDGVHKPEKKTTIWKSSNQFGPAEQDHCVGHAPWSV